MSLMSISTLSPTFTGCAWAAAVVLVGVRCNHSPRLTTGTTVVKISVQLIQHPYNNILCTIEPQNANTTTLFDEEKLYMLSTLQW